MASLATLEYEPALAPERVYLPRHDRKDLATLRVSVVPRSAVETIASRGSYQHDLIVEVGIQKQFSPATEQAEVDALMQLFDLVKRHVRFRKLVAGYTWVATENVTADQLWLPQHLRELHVFTAMARVTHRGLRRHVATEEEG